jgi:hypothetical protein
MSDNDDDDNNEDEDEDEVEDDEDDEDEDDGDDDGIDESCSNLGFFGAQANPTDRSSCNARHSVSNLVCRGPLDRVGP